MTKTVAIILLFCLTQCCVAQFNDSTNYFIKVSSTGVYNKTNERNSYLFNQALRFSIYKKNVSVNTNNAWIYGKQQHQLSNNDFASTLDFDLYKTKRHIYYWGLLNYESSFSLKIDHRFQAGLGVGYYLIDRQSFVLQLSDGILYERSELFPQEGIVNNDYETYRNSFRLKFRVNFGDLGALEGVNFIQHSLSDRKDYIIRSTTNLSVKLWKWLSLMLNLNYNKLNFTSRENFLLNYGVTIEKYF